MGPSKWLAKRKRSPPRPVKNGGDGASATPLPNDEQLSSLPNMPKALPAVGLAACALQLVDFATKILISGHEFYQPRVGSGVDNAHLLRAVTHELYRLTEALNKRRSKKIYNEKRSGKLEDATQLLLRLSESTQEVIVQLIDGLNQAQAKCVGGESTWTNLREPLMTVWTKGAITTQKKKLQLQRKEIDMALLRALKAYIDQSSEKGLSMISLEHTQAYHQEAWQHEAIEAISTNDWKAKNKKHVEEFAKLVDNLVLAEIEARFRDLTFANLHFPEQDDRLHSISKPNEDSFQWIWNSRQQGKGSFPVWLGDTSGQNVFWLTGTRSSYHEDERQLIRETGKPGSGKSTLMKYLFRNEELFPFLERWSGHSPGILTGFFLWNCGTDLQKTTMGLLRTLLYEALQDMIFGPLDEDPSIVQRIFAERWKQFSSYGGGIHKFSLSELRTAFDLMLSDTTKKFLLMIDGLDELDDDPTNALTVLISASNRENVKVCISSRPSVIYQATFKDWPSLELNKWTRKGIQDYVLYAFDQNDTMFNIPAEKSDGTEERAIINTLIDKASGVFLWASLATEFLIQSTKESDDVSTIKWRVNALPQELEALLIYMFDNLDAQHFAQAARLFRLVDAHGYPSLLPLTSAVDTDTRSALEADTRPLTVGEVLTRTEKMRNVLVFKCKNLVSIFEAVPADSPRTSVEVANFAHYKVNYAHRCIRDFLRSYEMRSRIATATNYEAFVEDEYWANAHLWSLKTLQPRDGKLLIWDTLADCIEHALRLESNDGRVRLTYLDEVNATLAEHLINPATPVQSMDLPPGAMVNSFGDISVLLNLGNYLTIKARSADKKDLRHAIEYAKDVRKRLDAGGLDMFLGKRGKLRESYEKVDTDLASLLEYHTKSSLKLGSPKITRDMPEWV
ncbi:uncharacterized protein N0V89_012475 [Didymosphaeria variabile]|uniref:NACHT domain-containing protein n=1 Tax=Didymosphaeria variabile TaxID=1932322 RepID=A0A9W9C5G3_9PLEO|nr:uncharacterized protein N0V89_012475 [Didymosphaeria variabile]KAJ4344731.1 hypothetical protein N0V89_012475 [Didymosphaeria variabile]